MVHVHMSVPFRLITYDQVVAAATGASLLGAAPKARAFTLRIQGKVQVRADLEQAFAYSYRALFRIFRMSASTDSHSARADPKNALDFSYVVISATLVWPGRPVMRRWKGSARGDQRSELWRKVQKLSG